METIDIVDANTNTFQSETKRGPLHHIRKQRQRSSITETTQRGSIETSYINNDNISLGSASFDRLSSGYHDDRLPDVHVLRRDNGGYTAPTMFSVVSHSEKSSSRSLFRRDAPSNVNIKSPLRRFFSKHGRRRTQFSEDQLRKQITKYSERGDWSRVRKLISNHDFTEAANVVFESNSIVAKSCTSSGGKPSSAHELVQGPTRRPSYGSRNGDRLSFTGKESAAAAAMIKAAAAAELLEDSSGSEECNEKIDLGSGENLLHDVCCYRPPADVVELLLVAMRHRRGSTCGRDEKGRTPLHVAVASGASSGVIDALTRADPTPASMGDVDKRSPLHLAVKFLAYEERHLLQNQPIPRQKSSSKKFFTMSKGRMGAPILSKEEALEETRQIVLILKCAMLTYPGQIDFKDEDEKGFAPLDYAIDGSVRDESLLSSLLRRDKSQVLGRRPTLKSEASDRTEKTRNCFSKFAKQTIEESLNTRRSSVSSQGSIFSQDSKVVQQFEEEEIEARRHRINRINSRKKKVIVHERLFDVFGIEEEDSPPVHSDEQLVQELCPEQLQGEPSPSLPQEEPVNPLQNLKKQASDLSNDKQQKSPIPRKASKRASRLCRELSCSMTTQGTLEAAKLAAVKCAQEQDSTAVTQCAMTEEEMYNHHMQAYLADTFGDLADDLEFCDDLDFLYDDPDEIEVDKSAQGQNLNSDGYEDEFIFEIVCPIGHGEMSLESDDCSSITFI